MTALADAAMLRRPNLAVLGGIACGVLVGILVAWNPIAAVALLFALVYAPLAMTNLPLAVGLWMPLLFLEGLPGASNLPEAGAAVIAIAWLGEVIRPDSWQREQLRRHGRMLTLVCLFIFWLALTLAWAQDPGRGVGLVASGVEVAIIFTLVSTTPSKTSHLRTVAAGFVAGAVLSALIGIVGQAAGLAMVDQEGRLQGGAGDPNFFASQLVAGLVLAVGLLATVRRPAWRMWLIASLPPLAYGIVASESRGGFVALAAVGIASIIVFRRYRLQVLLLVAGLSAVMGIWITSDTAVWQRITHSSQDRGAGREDLWHIALRMSSDYPIVGVGLNNFAVHSPDYTREPGALTGVKQVELGNEAHSAYLGLLAETGIVGLALFLSIVSAGVVSASRAAKRFEIAGDDRGALLAQAVMVALVGMLSSAVFLPDSEDKRIWVLLALAVACLGVATHASTAWQRRARLD